MTVPKISQLYAGVAVNIVLKTDQRSGKLTTGRISDILTKGNHPHGIKVRLADGQIGRVQSLSSLANPSTTTLTSSAATIFGVYGDGAKDRHSSSEKGRDRTWSGKSAKKEDYREDSTPLESRSLVDYMKVPTSSRPRFKVEDYDPKDTDQAKLEKEFPKLDTSLIAAIVADYDDLDTARSVLFSLSGE